MDGDTAVKFTLQGDVQQKVLTIDDVKDYLDEWAAHGDKVVLEIIGGEEE